MCIAQGCSSQNSVFRAESITIKSLPMLHFSFRDHRILHRNGTERPYHGLRDYHESIYTVVYYAWFYSSRGPWRSIFANTFINPVEHNFNNSTVENGCNKLRIAQCSNSQHSNPCCLRVRNDAVLSRCWPSFRGHQRGNARIVIEYLFTCIYMNLLYQTCTPFLSISFHFVSLHCFIFVACHFLSIHFVSFCLLSFHFLSCRFILFH